ncbi:unnamed protein product [Protopolystoma xenopodis]|uniref:Uncharacterized protein n=1 Tax=Protopolystoma xenopodis TaxID=117903 RepID=A0A3S4ZZC5_9PLAT|nr:unnamed protein product [Protopolystoma xenopodis]
MKQALEAEEAEALENARKASEEADKKRKANETAKLAFSCPGDKGISSELKDRSPDESSSIVSNKIDQSRCVLKNQPSIIVQRQAGADFYLQVIGLDVVLETRSGVMDEDSYELKQVVKRPRIAGKPDDDDSDYKTIDIPLLYACAILDPLSRGFFLLPDVESFIFSLGLPVSRLQVRQMLRRVSGIRNRIFYRSLTDVMASSKVGHFILSDIDDEEYMQELVRGGDAVLEEHETESNYPASAIILSNSDDLDTLVHASDATGDSSTPATGFLMRLRRLEMEKQKMQMLIRRQSKEIGNTLNENAKEIPLLRQRIREFQEKQEEYYDRYWGERDKVHTAVRYMEGHLGELSSMRSSLSAVLTRIRSRPKSKQTNDGKSEDSATVSESENIFPAPNDPVAVKKVLSSVLAV